MFSLEIFSKIGGALKTGLQKLGPQAPLIVILLVCFGGLAALHYLFPQERVVEKTEIHETVREVTKTEEFSKELSKLREELKEAKTAMMNERYRKEKTWNKAPDGTESSHEVEEKNISSVVTETKESVKVQVVEVEKQVVVVQTNTVERQVEVEKIREPALRNWRVSPMVGVAFDAKPGFNGVVYGAEAERRILGPVWVGVWGAGNTTVGGMVGVKASLEF